METIISKNELNRDNSQDIIKSIKLKNETVN